MMTRLGHSCSAFWILIWQRWQLGLFFVGCSICATTEPRLTTARWATTHNWRLIMCDCHHYMNHNWQVSTTMTEGSRSMTHHYRWFWSLIISQVMAPRVSIRCTMEEDAGQTATNNHGGTRSRSRSRSLGRRTRDPDGMLDGGMIHHTCVTNIVKRLNNTVKRFRSVTPNDATSTCMAMALKWSIQLGAGSW